MTFTLVRAGVPVELIVTFVEEALKPRFDVLRNAMSTSRRTQDLLDLQNHLGTHPRDEEARRLLEAGFEPSKNPYLRGLLQNVATRMAEDITQEGRIEVLRSANVKIQPDPIDVLGENEVYLFLTEPIDPTQKVLVGELDCEIVVTRSPTLLADQVVKCRSVRCARLRNEFPNLQNILIVNTKDSKKDAIAARLNGDFDGDDVQVFLDHAIGYQSFRWPKQAIGDRSGHKP